MFSFTDDPRDINRGGFLRRNYLAMSSWKASLYGSTG